MAESDLYTLGNNKRRAPLAVDLDGTLLSTDTLHETLVHNFFKNPISTVGACFFAFKGRAAFKAKLADIALPDIDSMPVNKNFLDYIKGEHQKGRAIHLATAADSRIANKIAGRFPWIASVSSTKDGQNLKGAAKAENLAQQFPEGYVYAGDSAADIAVWEKADGAIPVNVSTSTAASLEQSNTPIEKRFDPEDGKSGFHEWRRALRLHQWSKNVLLFVPLLLSHSYFDLSAVLTTLLGFIIIGATASGTYIINDLADLSADRRHASKCNRPFASGRIPILQGAAVAIALILSGLITSFILFPAFGYTLLIYLMTTLAYSFRLKRIVMLDVFLLSALFTLRIFMGMTLVGVSVSIWLIAFSCFFFFSLSMAKRYVELVGKREEDANTVIPGRGYHVGDTPLVLAQGVAASAAAIIIVVLYLSLEAFPSEHYSSPNWLWASPVIIAGWMQRIWLLAHRGELLADPVSFALRDPASIMMGAAVGVFFVAATVL